MIRCCHPIILQRVTGHCGEANVARERNGINSPCLHQKDPQLLRKEANSFKLWPISINMSFKKLNSDSVHKNK